jgi:hypothetical protein
LLHVKRRGAPAGFDDPVRQNVADASLRHLGEDLPLVERAIAES